MNSQIVAINQAAKSENTFYLVSGLIPVSLFLDSGFVSVAVIWFCVLCLYNYAKPSRERFRRYHLLLLPIFYFAWNALGIFFSKDYSLAFHLLLREIHLLLIPLGFLIVDKHIGEKQSQTVLALFLAACLLSSFVCVVHGIWNIIGLEGFTQNDFPYFDFTEPVDISPTYFALLCNWALFITLATPFFGPLLKTMVAFYIAAFIFLLSSVVGIVSLVLLIGLWILATIDKKWCRYVIIIGLVIGLLFGLDRFSSNSEAVGLVESEAYGGLVNSMSSRMEIWSYAWKTISKSPFIGHGLGGGQQALEQTYRQVGFEWGLRESLNAHNQFLSVFLDIGVMGAAVLVAMLLVPLIETIRSKDLLPLGFLLMTIVFFCFESVLVRQKGIVFFSFFYSLLFSHSVWAGLRK